MSSKDSAIGSGRPGSPPLPRPSKLQKVSGLRWFDKLPSEMDPIPAAPLIPRDPIVIREFGASSGQGTASFICTSGELLWGQLNTVIEGSKSKELDTTSGPHETFTSGTIIENTFRYRAKARKGSWKVEPAFIGDWHIGYVCYNEDVDGVDILRQAAKVGISNSNDHQNRDVVYVNRYDWGRWHFPGLPVVLETLDLGMSEDDVTSSDDAETMYLWRLISTRLMLLDPKGLPALIQALKEGERLERKNYLLHYPPVAAPEACGTAEEGKVQNPKAAESLAPVTTTGEPDADSSVPMFTSNERVAEETGNSAGSVEGAGNDGESLKLAMAEAGSTDPFGVNLVTNHPEYELGWMVFEKGELVGFVYDGEYSALEVDPDRSELKLGETVVTGLDHDSEEDEDPPYIPSSDTESTDSESEVRYYAGSETESEAGSQATSGQTAGSRGTQGGDEEQGEECMSKDISPSAPVLETINEEVDLGEPSEQITVDVRQVIEDEQTVAAASPRPSSLS